MAYIREIRGHTPQVGENTFLAETAVLVGDVTVGRDCSIWYNAVLRGDVNTITIGDRTNIQDGVVIHSKSGAPVVIGEYSSIAHRSIVHGPCEVGDRVFLGFNSVLFNCRIGEGCVVRHNAVVDGCDLPPGFYVPSTTRIGPKTDLTQIPRVTANATEFSEDVAHTNIDLVKGYKALSNEF